MLKNYLKVALRNIARHKAYSIINVTGLAVGMACCLLLSLYVIHELNYDRGYPDSDRIYRVVTHKQTKVEEMQFAGASPLLIPILREECSEVEAAFAARSLRPTIVRRDVTSAIEDRIGVADDGIFGVLGLRLIHGQPAGSLTRPRTVVLTQGIAHKYFGDENPIGKTLQIDTIAYEITAVVADQPTNTHLKFTMLCSSTTKMMDEREMPPVSWSGPLQPTYVKLAPGADPEAFEARIRNLPTERGKEEQDATNEVHSFSLQPIADIHLSPPLRWEVERPGNPTYVVGMAATAILVFLIACVNFLNLNTARAAGRAMEVGIRKAAGAQRPQLFWQFMSESLLLSLLASGVSIALAELALPGLSATFLIPFTTKALLQPEVIVLAVGAVIIVSLLAGGYPALYLSGMRPVRALKNQTLVARRRRIDLRKVLVVGQLIIVGVLVVGVVTVYRQMQFMRNRPLGFDMEQKLVIEFNGGTVDRDNYQAVKETFMAVPAVSGATISTSVPGRWNYQWRTEVSGKEAEGFKRVNWYGIDGDFLREYGIEIVAGGPAHREQTGIGGLLINEAAVRTFGWGTNEEAIGQRLNNNPVAGVVKDFHFRGLQTPVEPLAMFSMNEDYRYLSLRIDIRNLTNTMNAVELTFKQLFPGGVFNYFFLDDDFDRQYLLEASMARICAAFTVVGIVVAYLGLYALAVFLAKRRTKEIGVRKVLGATTRSIVLLLLGEFIPLLTIAAVVAAPVAYLITGKWLQQFAYRIDNGLLTVIVFVVSALLIVGASISWQAIRAARANPVDSLKYE
jgi:putative ABC transport system permease protein